MSSNTLTASATLEMCSELIQKGDIDGVMALYDEDSVLVLPDQTFRGLAAIREAMEPIVGMKGKMTKTLLKAIETNDTASTSYRLQLVGTDPDGVEVTFSGVTADILRRRADGSWAIIIDDPYGGEPSDVAKPSES